MASLVGSPVIKGAFDGLASLVGFASLLSPLGRVKGKQSIKRNRADGRTFKERTPTSLGMKHGVAVTSTGGVHTCAAPSVDSMKDLPYDRQMAALVSALTVCRDDHEFRQSHESRRAVDALQKVLKERRPTKNSARIAQKYFYEANSTLLFYDEMLNRTLPRILKQARFVDRAVRGAVNSETKEPERVMEQWDRDFMEPFTKTLTALVRDFEATHVEVKETIDELVRRFPEVKGASRRLGFEESKK